MFMSHYATEVCKCPQQSPQFLVKVIKVDGIVKMAVGLEYMSGLVLFHRTEVVRQTEIAHDF